MTSQNFIQSRHGSQTELRNSNHILICTSFLHSNSFDRQHTVQHFSTTSQEYNFLHHKTFEFFSFDYLIVHRSVRILPFKKHQGHGFQNIIIAIES